MNNILAFNIQTPQSAAQQIAARVKARRLELNLTQEGMATRAGLKFATYRRFEQTGEISLKGLLQIYYCPLKTCIPSQLAEIDKLGVIFISDKPLL